MAAAQSRFFFCKVLNYFSDKGFFTRNSTLNNNKKRFNECAKKYLLLTVKQNKLKTRNKENFYNKC